jgi:hypothetical protein
MLVVPGAVAQLGERLNGIQEVRGSNPPQLHQDDTYMTENIDRRLCGGFFLSANSSCGDTPLATLES